MRGWPHSRARSGLEWGCFFPQRSPPDAQSTSTMRYHANGNVTNDGSSTYSYDAEGRPVTAGGVQIFYDGFNRPMAKNNGGTYTQILYSPTGQRFALMSGGWAASGTYFVPLAAGLQAVYSINNAVSTLAYYRHADWLGSSRFAGTTSGTVYFDRAFAPFGEPYAESGAADRSFTGQTQDEIAGPTGNYDFLFRQHSSAQGRWLVPDPAGLAAVDITNPQTWNRYAYVANNPLGNIDPLGLDGDQPPPIPWGSPFCGGDPIVCALG